MMAAFVAPFNRKMVQPGTTHNLLLSITRRFSVTRNARELVRPSEPTPSGRLPLSAIDNRRGYNFYASFLFVYRYGQETAARVIKEALSKALVPYYPVAGRLGRSQHRDDHMEIHCSDDDGGVIFVEASADCKLEDSGYLCDPSQPYAVPQAQLVPCLPTDAEARKPIFLMQVTQFKCGGFVVGVHFHHSVFDGIGGAQFMNAIAEISRGLLQPTTKPFWFREHILDPQQFIFILPSAREAPTPYLQEHLIDLSPDQINQLKNKYTKETGKKCSSFDILSALLWQARTRATNIPPHTNITLKFAINMRPTMNQVLPFRRGYYGNLVCAGTVTNTSEFVCQAKSSEVVNMVRDAKQGSYPEWVEIDMKTYLPFNISDARYLGFYEIDYGWGAPASILPYVPNSLNTPSASACLILQSPVFKGGVRLWTLCVLKEHSADFLNQMKTIL